MEIYGFVTSVLGYDSLTGPWVCGNESVGSEKGETFVLCWFVGLLACLIACLLVGLLVYLLHCYIASYEVTYRSMRNTKEFV